MMNLESALTFAVMAVCLHFLPCCSAEQAAPPASQHQRQEKEEPRRMAQKRERPDQKTTDDRRPIGNATMDKDGTIALMLRAESRHNGQDIVGDALISYRKNDPDYQMILNHLGGMRPGESKTVYPFPDKGR